MKLSRFIFLTNLIALLCLNPNGFADFGLAENSLSEYRAIRYENIYTKVPTTGKLVSIKIADDGVIYYICREKNSYAIYHLEIRPMENFKDKIEQDSKDKTKKWEKIHPEELLLTKDRHDYEVKKKLKKYSEAVWIRNEIVIDSRQ
ncbi:MAG: hypothetical protein PHS86_03495 [Syntrophaceae bacterium]|nr:hypothetical protein [Syntrophaceae bacterium]